MPSGELDVTALIICACVIVPALIAIGVCAIIYFSNRSRDRKLYRQTDRSPSYEYEQPRERATYSNYVIDSTHRDRSQQQRRLRLPPPVFEQSPPSYDASMSQTGRQVQPLFTPIHAIASARNIHESPSIISPSIYSAMPPSYAEIFLKPQTSSNR